MTLKDIKDLVPGDRVRFDDGTFTVKRVEVTHAESAEIPGRVRVDWTDGSHGYFWDWENRIVFV